MQLEPSNRSNEDMQTLTLCPRFTSLACCCCQHKATFSAEGHSIRSVKSPYSPGRASAAGEINPLFKVGRPLLALGEILFQAALRAELLMRKPVANKTEAPLAHFTAWLSSCHHGICSFAHTSGFVSCVVRNSLIAEVTAIFDVNLTR